MIRDSHESSHYTVHLKYEDLAAVPNFISEQVQISWL